MHSIENSSFDKDAKLEAPSISSTVHVRRPGNIGG